jgi:hypothetical protein
MTREEAIAFIRGTEGRIFSVEFRKRSDGTLRQMVARTGVKSHLKGGKPAYNFSDKGLLSVFDMQEGGYRCIPTEGILRIKINGEWQNVVDNPANV